MKYSTVLVACLLSTVAITKEQYKDQFAQYSPAQREWFNKQMVPGTRNRCCSVADGTFAGEDIRTDEDGSSHYWTSYEAMTYDEQGNITGKVLISWTKVPDDVVITEGNPLGVPTVWYLYRSSGVYEIRCFSPGPKF